MKQILSTDYEKCCQKFQKKVHYSLGGPVIWYFPVRLWSPVDQYFCQKAHRKNWCMENAPLFLPPQDQIWISAFNFSGSSISLEGCFKAVSRKAISAERCQFSYPVDDSGHKKKRDWGKKTHFSPDCMSVVVSLKQKHKSTTNKRLCISLGLKLKKLTRNHTDFLTSN